MSYVKLCQIVYQGNPNSLGNPQTCYHLEDMHGNIQDSATLTYPVTFQVEVIDWVSQDEMNKLGNINNFYHELVTLNSIQVSIRQDIFNQLIIKYPTLII